MTLKILSKRCDQCLFSKARIVSAARKRELLADIRRTQGYFVCHKATQAGEDAMCRGFHDERGPESQMLRIAGRLNMIRYVEESELVADPSPGGAEGGRVGG